MYFHSHYIFIVFSISHSNFSLFYDFLFIYLFIYFLQKDQQNIL